MNFLTNAEPANFGDGVVGCSSFHNNPVDVERDTVFDEASEIGTECSPLCSVFSVLMSELCWLYLVFMGLKVQTV